MNERIQELAEQAGFVNLNADYWDCTTDGMKKFAELIVRECADHIDDLITCDDDGNQILDCDDVRTELLEHFGVEE